MKTWPIIRHIRWYLWKRQFTATYAEWRRQGFNPANWSRVEMFLNRVWEGKA